MLEFPKDISKARVLISNDDGIHAEGIARLEKIVRGLCNDVAVVAPETPQSAAGHSLSIHTPLRVKHYSETRASVWGTPTDSVLFGVQTLMADKRPDIVLSGINHGQNTADDVTYSGTIAAAIEATLLGIPAVALSQDITQEHEGGKPDWSVAEEYLPRILQALQGMAWENNVLLSVNFPVARPGITPEIRVLPQGHFSVSDQSMIARVDPRGRPYYWVGPPPKRSDDQRFDFGALRSGHITITPLCLNLTHYPTMTKLLEVFPA